MQQNTAVLTEQEIMNDALSSEKQIISAYGTFLAESTCENLRSEMTKILNDKQQYSMRFLTPCSKRVGITLKTQI